jgi:hypothetical protein
MLTHKIDMCIPEDFPDKSRANIPIRRGGSEVMEMENGIPTPKQQRSVTTDCEREDINSQAESVDDFETPRALKRNVSDVLSDNFDPADSDVVDQEVASEYERIQDNESENSLDDNSQREYKSDTRTGNVPKKGPKTYRLDKGAEKCNTGEEQESVPQGSREPTSCCEGRERQAKGSLIVQSH